MSKLQTLFWPISRDILSNYSVNVNQTHRIRSVITYQILFGGKLVIRDTDYLNSLALRVAINDDMAGCGNDDSMFYRTLIDTEYLGIAKRVGKSLGEIAETLIKNGGQADFIQDEWFNSEAKDIAFLESCNSSGSFYRPFELSEASSYYTNTLLRLLSEPLDAILPENIRTKVHDLVTERAEDTGSVGWEFLSPTGAIWSSFNEREKNLYVDTLYRKIGQAPHAGFIPHSLNLSPIYMQDVAESIDLWRGRHLEKPDVVGRRTIQLGSGFSLSDYVECLAVLPATSVIKLAQSDENNAFRSSFIDFSLEKCDLALVEHFYRDYRAAIDSEIANFRYSGVASGGEASLSAEVGNETVNVVMEEVVGSVVPGWKLGLSLFERIAKGEWPRDRIQRIAREENQTRMTRDYQELQFQGEKIESKTIANVGDLPDHSVDFPSSQIDDICIS